MMKCISVQLQPDRNPSHEVSELIDLVRSIGLYPEIDKSESSEKYINLNFFTEDFKGFWHDIESKVLAHKFLGSWVKDVSIIVCEGDQGWDNYLVLSHYDDHVNLDEL